MKKFIVLCMIIIILITGCASEANNINKANNLYYQSVDTLMQSVCEGINASTQDSSKFEKAIDNAFDEIIEYLYHTNDPQSLIRKLNEGIEGFRLLESNTSFIIGYTSSPDLFGESGKSSWYLLYLKEKSKASVILRNVPINIEHLRDISINNSACIAVYGYNYAVNKHRAYINAYEIGEKGITEVQSVFCGGGNVPQWNYDNNEKLIYTVGEYSTYIQDISEDGNEVVIKELRPEDNDNTLVLKLKLTEDGYQVTE